MTAQDVRLEPPPVALRFATATTRLLASALLHVLDRDEPLPARWHAASFAEAVARHRERLAVARTASELDAMVAPGVDPTFRGAVAALGSDPLAAALAVRRTELNRGLALPVWSTILRHGIGPRVSRADAARWFG